MCRWISYIGNPIPLETLITEPENSLICQSLSAKMGVNPTNADGVGLGWYGRNNEPGVYHSVLPAWGDQNLREIAHQVESHLFLAHIRHSTGTPVQSTNCHPFRYANWLFVHNGLIRGFHKIHRELLLAIAPEYFPAIKGSTDSEIIFYLAKTFGLAKNPIEAMEKAIGFIEDVAKAHDIENPIQASFGISDGETLYAIRYSSEGDSRTLFHTADPETMKELMAKTPHADLFGSHAHAVVSEPLGDKLPGLWVPVEEATAITINKGELKTQSFTPKLP